MITNLINERGLFQRDFLYNSNINKIKYNFKSELIISVVVHTTESPLGELNASSFPPFTHSSQQGYVYCPVPLLSRMPICASGHQMLVNTPPREAEDTSGVVCILSISLYSHISLLATKRVLVGRIYLCVRGHYRTLY